MKGFYSKDNMKKQLKEKYTKKLYFDRERKIIGFDVDIYASAPTLENMLSTYSMKINSILRTANHVTDLNTLNIIYIVINEEYNQIEIKLTNETNIYNLLLSEKVNIYCVRSLTSIPKEVPKPAPCVQYIKDIPCQVYSKKAKKFVKATIFLYAHALVIKKAKIKSIYFADIEDITNKVTLNDVKHNGYLISIKFATKTKILSMMKESEYQSWYSLLISKINIWREGVIVSQCETKENETLQSINSSINTIISNLFELKGILSMEKSRSIFFKYCNDLAMKNLYEAIVLYKQNVINQKYNNALIYYERAMSIIILKGGIIAENMKEYVNNNNIDILKNVLSQLNECKEGIRKECKENPNSITGIEINKRLKNLFPVNLFDEIQACLFNNYFEKIYEERNIKDDPIFIKELEGVLLYYYEKDNNFSSNEFIDIQSISNERSLSFQK